MIDLIVRYRWTFAWTVYVTYCIAVFRVYEVLRR